MVTYCAVYGCTSKKQNNIHFYSFPKPKKRIICVTKNELLKRRRKAWYHALHRTDITIKQLDSRAICEKHFVSGAPCDVMDENNIDWCPTLHLGKNKETKTTSSRERKQREIRPIKQSLEIVEESDTTVDSKNDSTTSTSILTSSSSNNDSTTSTSILTSSSSNNVDSTTSTSILTLSSQVEIDTAEFDVLNQSGSTQVFDSSTTKLNSSFNLLAEYQARLNEIHELRSKLDHINMDENCFKNDDKKVRFYTGLSSFKLLKLILTTIEKPLTAIKETQSKLTNFQKLLLTLMKLRGNCTLTDLSYRFDISVAQASTIFKKVVVILKHAFESVVLWPERDALRTLVPVSFRERFGNRVAVIIDCFEIASEKPSSMKAQSLSYSQYKAKYTIKYLIGITPQGVISFISKGYGGRVSDNFVTTDCGICNLLLPGDIILADRGFTVTELVAVHQAELKTPAFTRGKTQLSPTKVENTRDLASVRIHVERVIGTIREKYQILKGPISIKLLRNKFKEERLLDIIVKVCCILTNLCDSIIPLYN